MIDKWILNNFKSIDEELELEFKPLTIFTGANSSGKSTVLQSILLITQTLQNQMASRSVVLNGWFKKFGSFTDIVNKRDTRKHLKIGFSLSEDPSNQRNRLYSWFGEDLTEVSCSFEVESHKEEDDLQPILKQMELESQDSSNNISRLVVKNDDQKSEKEIKILNDHNISLSDVDFANKIIVDSSPSRFRFLRNGKDLTPFGVNMFHFLPNYMISYYSIGERMKANLPALLFQNDHYSDLSQLEEKQMADVIKEKALKIAADNLHTTHIKNQKTSDRLYKKLWTNFTVEGFSSFLRNTDFSDEVKEKMITPLYDEIKKFNEDYGIDKTPMFYYPGVEYVRDFYNSRIKYLGPLREEPKSLYPLESTDSIIDVGLKGENTAAVFDYNKNKVIEYVDPEHFKDVNNLSLSRKSGTLSDAIISWLEYLGVAHNIVTYDKGKVGHELKITTDIPNMEQDLTHVGVGVSQVLPILVMSFLAAEGAVIILEQPELHLHPKVQTRLADFFVSMNTLGKQCIIETHSEYLINRLRLLVARSNDEKISENSMIYFVEKENGHSQYRQIKINKYGVIGDWPDGFFDEGEDLATAIVKAGMEKRRRELQLNK